MKITVRFLLAFLIAFALMMVVRAVGITIYTIDDTSLEPIFQAGDRVMVNRWSYGLKVGGKDSFFDYGRIARQSVGKGDLVALEHPHNSDQILICRCIGLPGDTIDCGEQQIIVPSLKDCADADYYWFESISPADSTDSHIQGLISEEYIIGRVFMVAYSRNPLEQLWKGWRTNRIFLPV